MIFNKIKLLFFKLLKRSEKFTQTDMVYLAKGGFWLSLSKILNAASAFILSVLFANFLAKDLYGVYKYVLSIASILTITTLPGVNTAITRSVAIGAEGFILKAIKLKIKFGVIGFLVGLGISGYYMLNGNTTLAYSVFIASLLIIVIDSFFVHGPYLHGKKDFKKTALFSTITQFSIMTAIAIVLFLKLGVVYIILAFYSANLLIQLIFTIYTFKKIPPNKKVDGSMLSYGKHLSLMTIFETIATQIDKIIMWHFLGPIQLAIYSFAIAPIFQFRNFLKSTSSLAFPKLANKNIAELQATLPKKIFKFFLLLFIPVIFYILLAPFLFKIFFPSYMDSVIYSQIFALSLLFYPQSLIGATFTAQARKKTLYILKLSSPIILIILILIMIPVYGIMGAILAKIFASLINTFILFYFFKKAK